MALRVRIKARPRLKPLVQIGKYSVPVRAAQRTTRTTPRDRDGKCVDVSCRYGRRAGSRRTSRQRGSTCWLGPRARRPPSTSYRRCSGSRMGDTAPRPVRRTLGGSPLRRQSRRRRRRLLHWLPRVEPGTRRCQRTDSRRSLAECVRPEHPRGCSAQNFTPCYVFVRHTGRTTRRKSKQSSCRSDRLGCSVTTAPPLVIDRGPTRAVSSGFGTARF